MMKMAIPYPEVDSYPDDPPIAGWGFVSSFSSLYYSHYYYYYYYYYYDHYHYNKKTKS